MATINDAAWIAGFWTADGPDGVVEDGWSPPVGKQMVGHSTVRKDGVPKYQELFTVDETEDGRIEIRLMRLNPDLTPLFKKPFELKFVSAKPGHITWEGFELVKHGDDEMECIYFDINTKKTVKIMYHRNKG